MPACSESYVADNDDFTTLEFDDCSHRLRMKTAMDLAADAMMLMADALHEDEVQSSSARSDKKNISPRRAQNCSCTLPTQTRNVNHLDIGVVPVEAFRMNAPQEIVDNACTLSENEIQLLKDGAEIELLFSRGLNLNAIHGDGFTALQRAAMKGNAPHVELLLSMGADPNSNGARCSPSAKLHETQMPPIALALQGGHLAITKALVDAGAILVGELCRDEVPCEKGMQ